MSSRARKRKQRPYESDRTANLSKPDSSLLIQAYEADLVHGPQATLAAKSLEVSSSHEGKTAVGDALIRWDRAPHHRTDDLLSEDRVDISGAPRHVEEISQDDNREMVWVDRYDARLLLDSLPAIISPSAEALVEEPDSPSGWSDLPSDAEDTFFFSCAEAEDYRREKRRRVIDGDREARLQALRAEAGGDDDDLNAEEEWGGSDEEPDDGQHELMRRTASHIFTSPNPAQLEMRILANHGADTRFAFLRGRWSRAWRLAKAKARLESDTEKKRKEDEAKQSASGGMGGLAGYGDSDEEEDGEAEDQDGSTEVSATNTPDGDALKAARRARAREWAEKRRAVQQGNATDTPNGNE
ncbi:hypothetical protein C8Q80DRAFT_1260916 [Daedaleopsis nitida]|nr:hypothetical protein C8Q80DRAFT_1260916 [Daedaleopsis nitida]